MVRQYIKFAVLLSAIVTTTIGCSDDDAGPKAKKPNGTASKPLPESCDDNEKMPIEYVWDENKQVYEYSIEFGYHGSPAYDFIKAGKELTGYSFPNGRRGKGYHFTISRTLKNGQQIAQFVSVTIPKCADRLAYQQAHPDYAEPIVMNVKFE